MTWKPPWPARLWESASFRLTVTVAFTIIMTAMPLNLFWSWQENNSLQEGYLKQGRSLAKLLAYNSRLGIFTANPQELSAQAEAALDTFTCRMVALFDSTGQMLLARPNPQLLLEKGRQDDLLQAVGSRLATLTPTAAAPVQLSVGGDQVIIAPVFTRHRPDPDSLFFSAEPPEAGQPEIRQGRLIGYAVLFLDSGHVSRKAAAILFKNSATSLLVMSLSCLAIVIGLRLVRKI